jgi:hypothetical protein
MSACLVSDHWILLAVFFGFFFDAFFDRIFLLVIGLGKKAVVHCKYSFLYVVVNRLK